MFDQIIEKTDIIGLHFEKNLSIGNKFYTHVIASSGPGISDFVTHSDAFHYTQYGIHIAQVDRLTFFGDPNQIITGHFVDCREGSPTLHKYVSIDYYPDPTKKLNIDRGIAHTFDGLENVLTRDEPIWYMSVGNSDYNMESDVINVPRELELNEFPEVTINKYPIPREAYEFVLGIQHKNMTELQEYPNRVLVNIDGEKRYVTITPKKGDKEN
ncbi:dTDP-4-dehydrorhamnose 3,5-epimerase [Geomicrobium halophilum]|uniref:dTDP-4-dehydrorhamnose 3,5-epimerase n=1 Tax=Geomicrobium halophilum TaxID=549000 RepID=A0A841Q1G8_9BACL|nr:dTDP-4-dehydrorhamnose 3,5-epimerase [Geomicrobium halophilum]MBB6449718.1 dTDP-4-dehydrorhamnose 3,5-epimerase [Geomicrobium halophilum]